MAQVQDKGHPLATKLALLVGSLVPFCLAILIIVVKIIREFIVIPLTIGIVVGSIVAGQWWYRRIRIETGETKDEETGAMLITHDWYSFFMGALVAFGVMLLMRVLFSHEVARAFDTF